jgi:hypothetical protein
MEIKEITMFFSVKVPMKIGGKSFHTCICYDLTETLKSTVERLAEEGKAVIYSELKFFCNGKIVEKKSVVKENLTTEKKEKKNKKIKVETVEATDETEGF